MAVPKNLLKVLACPRCKGVLGERGMFLICQNCKLAYPVLEGEVPDMLIKDAWPLSKAKNARFKHKIKL